MKCRHYVLQAPLHSLATRNQCTHNLYIHTRSHFLHKVLIVLLLAAAVSDAPRRRLPSPPPQQSADHTYTTIGFRFFCRCRWCGCEDFYECSVCCCGNRTVFHRCRSANQQSGLYDAYCLSDWEQDNSKSVSGFGSTDYERGIGRLDFEYPTDGDG